MVKLISKTELDTQKSDNTKTHNVGIIFPEIFGNEKVTEFKEGMQMEAAIMWLGAYYIDSSNFPKLKCPVCGKEEVLIPYQTIASVLSGAHTIKFWCSACNERFVTDDYLEYYHLIRNYVVENRKDFKEEQIIQGCPIAPLNAKFI